MNIDPEMAAVAAIIINRLSGHFDPTTFRDRHQEALRDLIEAKMKGLQVRPKEIAPPQPVHDLMVALKRSLARESATAWKPKRRAAGDRRQGSLLLPVSGRNKAEKSTPAAGALTSRRKKA